MLICIKIRLFGILFCYLSSSHTKLWINWSSSIHPCSQTLRCYCDTHKWELWRPAFPCYLLFAYYIQKEQWYKILTSLVAVITWAIFYLKLALCLTESHMKYRYRKYYTKPSTESTGRQAFLLLFISPKSSVHICKLSLGSHFVFSQRPFM